MKKKLWIIIIVGVILVSIALSFFAGNYIIEKGKAEHYQKQMIVFCEIVNIQEQILRLNNITEVNNVTIPKMKEDCNYWILS